jgi:hypothetical protein
MSVVVDVNSTEEGGIPLRVFTSSAASGALDPSQEESTSSASSVESTSDPQSAEQAPADDTGNSIAAWQYPLNFTQTVSGLTALAIVLFMLRPQLQDHQLNKWSALKDFRDDCRAQEVSFMD